MVEGGKRRESKQFRNYSEAMLELRPTVLLVKELTKFNHKLLFTINQVSSKYCSGLTW